MPTLLLRFAGPMQSWGSSSKFEVRRTELFPTKSGVVGLMAAALGKRREESLEDLTSLHIGIRVEDPGVMIEDYHTAQSTSQMYISRRFYLCDAVFLVGIESNSLTRLRDLAYAVQHPVFPLFLGRKSCPPTQPVFLEIVPEGLEKALETYPWQLPEKRQTEGKRYSRMILPAENSTEGAAFRDEPVSFSPQKRDYRFRFIQEKPIQFHPASQKTEEVASQASEKHDPFFELENLEKSV